MLPQEVGRDRGSSFSFVTFSARFSSLKTRWLLDLPASPSAQALAKRMEEKSSEWWDLLTGLTQKSSDCFHLGGQNLVVRS